MFVIIWLEGAQWEFGTDRADVLFELLDAWKLPAFCSAIQYLLVAQS